MSNIHFETKLYTIGTWTILRLPPEASTKLPSRGQVMVKGSVEGVPFQTPLEPDGAGSHWFKVSRRLQQDAKIASGATVKVSLEPTKDWPEPAVPADLGTALHADAPAEALWERITPLARWEWIRWVGATNRLETRARRIEVACSKLRSGMRRPCCFNRNACCVPKVSKNGVLLEPGM